MVSESFRGFERAKIQSGETELRYMRKGFTRKPPADAPTTKGKNYITPGGLQRLREEHRFLLTRERRAVTEVVAWAASNGDRSENAGYQCRPIRAAARSVPSSPITSGFAQFSATAVPEPDPDALR